MNEEVKKQRIRLRISKKEMRLLIRPEEEPFLREGAELLNNKLAEYAKTFGHDESSYTCMLMSAIDISSMTIHAKADADRHEMRDELNELNQRLTKIINNNSNFDFS